MSAAVTIDGNTVQTISGSVTRRLNAPSQGQIVVPMHLAEGDAGSRIKIVIDGENALHGFCTFVETSCGEDTGYTTYSVTDPMEMWERRPARDSTGDFSNPTFIVDMITGPQILEEILLNSNSGAGPALTEGPLFIDVGSFATGGESLAGAPTDWPMTIAEVASLLVSTGQLDIVAVPIDSGGNMARIEGYNGNYGSDLTGSVVLSYGMGAYNVRSLRWSKDLSTVINKLWTYLGPRDYSVQADPEGNQHWRANITGDDPGLADPPLSSVLARRASSQSAYGVRMEVQIFDGQGTESTVGRELYRWNWLAESWLRAMPRELTHITPVRGIDYGTFREGDVIAVQATSEARGGFSGEQRVYEYTASWDSDSVVTISELQTSPGNEGF